MAMKAEDFAEGQRVCLVRTLNTFTMGDVPKVGELGTVTVVSGEWGTVPVSAYVKFDEHYPDLDQWENEIQVGLSDESYSTPDDYEVVVCDFDWATLAHAARVSDNNAWGSEEQTDAENAFFAAFRAFMGPTPEFDRWCLKATTDEMIDEALNLIGQKTKLADTTTEVV